MQESGYKGWVGIEYVWIDWEHCNECDNLSETILFRDSSAPLRRNIERRQMMIETKSNVPVEITFTAAASYTHPFHEISCWMCFSPIRRAFGRRVPAFWAGGDTWRGALRLATSGTHTFHTECNVTADSGLHGAEGSLEITPYEGENPLLSAWPDSGRGQ